MKRVCCVCGLVLGEKEPLDDDSVTHSYCPQCLVEAHAELDAKLDAFRPPRRIRKRYRRRYWENVDRLCDERI